MELKVFAPVWGHEHYKQLDFLDKMRLAGYDGFDMWLPDDATARKELFDYLQKHELLIVAHQHQAAGSTFNEFKASFIKNLHNCGEAGPVVINSHTGRDYFTFEQNLALFEAATEFSEKTGITVAHETHRGRALYSPPDAEAYFNAHKQLNITADLSHWVCVSESMLGNFESVLTDAIARTRHIHARIGFEEGPQVPDPRAAEWGYALQHHLNWWDKMAEAHQQRGSKYLTFTTEFGPKPYMPTIPHTAEPIADQFEINCFMKDLLCERYKTLSH